MKDISKNIGHFYLFRDEYKDENGNTGRIIVQCGLEGGISMRNDGLWRYAIAVSGVDEIL